MFHPVPESPKETIPALREILAEHAYRESDKEYHNSDEGKEHWDGWEDDYGLEPLDFGDKD